eukprot:scaffold221557_cov61-Cyclotella_meneghiniana.AAC.2
MLMFTATRSLFDSEGGGRWYNVDGVVVAEGDVVVWTIRRVHSFTRRPPIRSATAVERSEGLRSPGALNPRFDPSWKQKKRALE